MSIELDNLKTALKDEVTKLKGHVTLDINLERGRSVEAVSVMTVMPVFLGCLSLCLLLKLLFLRAVSVEAVLW